MSPQFETARAQMVNGLVKNGVPRDEAIRSADVAIHAATEAAMTIKRICDPLQGREWTNAYGMAIQTGQLVLGAMLDEMRETAAKLGMQAREFTVDTRQ